MLEHESLQVETKEKSKQWIWQFVKYWISEEVGKQNLLTELEEKWLHSRGHVKRTIIPRRTLELKHKGKRPKRQPRKRWFNVEEFFFKHEWHWDIHRPTKWYLYNEVLETIRECGMWQTVAWRRVLLKYSTWSQCMEIPSRQMQPKETLPVSMAVIQFRYQEYLDTE
jgi:hypothetical protein